MDVNEIKKLLYKEKKTFDIALLANNDEQVINNYLLGICNTLTMNPSLLNCTPESIRDAAITSATLGIPIDARQYAYLVPYGNKAQFQLSYKGYVHVAKRDSDVDQIQSVLVYNDDSFGVNLGANSINHIPNLESKAYGDVDAIRYIYAVVRFKEGTGRSQMFEVMTRKQVDDIRDKAKQGHIWKSHFGEMARKTVIKRLCKHAQLGDIARFDEIDNGLEQGKIINLNPDGVVESVDLLEEDKNKILEVLEACTTEEEISAIGRTHFDKLEEIQCYSYHLSKEIANAMGKKTDLLYMERIQKTFEDCEDAESIDKVYEAHKIRINRLKARDRNTVEQTYCDCKERLIEIGMPNV